MMRLFVPLGSLFAVALSAVCRCNYDADACAVAAQCTTLTDTSGTLRAFEVADPFTTVRDEFGDNWSFDVASQMVVAMSGQWICQNITAIPTSFYATAGHSCGTISFESVQSSSYAAATITATPLETGYDTITVTADLSNPRTVDVVGLRDGIAYSVTMESGGSTIYTEDSVTPYCVVYASAQQTTFDIRGDAVPMEFATSQDEPDDAWLESDNVFVAPKDGLYSIGLNFDDVSTHPIKRLLPHSFWAFDSMDQFGDVPNEGTAGTGVAHLQGCCALEATDFTAPIGNAPHSLVMTAKFLTGAEVNERQWLLNFGQFGGGAEHWLENSYTLNGHSMDMQFGVWNGPQIQTGFDDTRIEDEQVLVTTWDGSMYRFYVDGDLIAESAFSSGFSINEARIRAGAVPDGWESSGSEDDFNGAVREVAYFDRVLTAAEVASMIRPECELFDLLFTGETTDYPSGTSLYVNPGLPTPTYMQNGTAQMTVTQVSTTPVEGPAFSMSADVPGGFLYTFAAAGWMESGTGSVKYRLRDPNNGIVGESNPQAWTTTPTTFTFEGVIGSNGEDCIGCYVELVFLSVGTFNFDDFRFTFNCTHDLVAAEVVDASGAALCRSVLPEHTGATATGACRSSVFLKEGDVLNVQTTAIGKYYHTAAAHFTAHLVDHSEGFMQVTFDMNGPNSGNAYMYIDFTVPAEATVPIEEGDYLEYEIYWDQPLARIAVDVELSGGGTGATLRDAGNTVDQNNVRAHPNQDLTDWAYDKWYKRKIAFVPSTYGRTVDAFTVASERDDDVTVSVKLRDVVLNRNGRKIVLWEYSSPTPTTSIQFQNLGPHSYSFDVPVTTANMVHVAAYAASHESVGTPAAIVYDSADATEATWDGSTFTVPTTGLYSISVNFVRDAVPLKGLEPMGYWDLDKRETDGTIMNEGFAPGGDAVKAGCCGMISTGLYDNDWGNAPHTIALVTVLPDPAGITGRQWILNLGQEGTGAHHWLDNPGNIQMGVWSGSQVQTNWDAFRRPDQLQVLVAVWDGATYSLYVDGALVQSSPFTSQFNIVGSNLEVGHAQNGGGGSGEIDYPGRTTEVAFYDRALTPNEVADLGPRGSHDDTFVDIRLNGDEANPLCTARVGESATHGLGSCSLAIQLDQSNTISTHAGETNGHQRTFYEVWTDIHYVGGDAGAQYVTAIAESMLSMMNTGSNMVMPYDSASLSVMPSGSFQSNRYFTAPSPGVYSLYVSFHKVAYFKGFSPGAWVSTSGSSSTVSSATTELACLTYALDNGMSCMNWKKDTSECIALTDCGSVSKETTYLDLYDYMDFGTPFTTVAGKKWSVQGNAITGATQNECIAAVIMDGGCGAHWMPSATQKCYSVHDCSVESAMEASAGTTSIVIGFSEEMTMEIMHNSASVCTAASGMGTAGAAACQTSVEAVAGDLFSTEINCGMHYKCAVEDVHFTAHRVHG